MNSVVQLCMLILSFHILNCKEPHIYKDGNIKKTRRGRDKIEPIFFFFYFISNFV